VNDNGQRRRPTAMVFPFVVSVYLESTPSDHDTGEENNESNLECGEPSKFIPKNIAAFTCRGATVLSFVVRRPPLATSGSGLFRFAVRRCLGMMSPWPGRPE